MKINQRNGVRVACRDAFLQGLGFIAQVREIRGSGAGYET
jgi:hypothetical protein